MPKILYLLIAFLVIIFASLIAIWQYDDDSDPASPLFQYSKLCNNKYCMPLDNLLINRIRKEIPPETIETQFNEFIEQNSELSLVKAKFTKEHQCQLTAFNSIGFDTKYLEFNISNVIHENIINKDYFDNSINLEKLESDQKLFQDWQIPQQASRVILSLLYHFTHLENSKFKSWIYTLPKEIYPLYYNLTHYELKLIEGDTIHKWVLHIVDQYSRDYKTLIQQIRKKNFSGKEQEFFNGYTLQFQDYAYARYICDIYGWNIQNKSAPANQRKEVNSKLYIVPGVNCLTKKAPETTLKYDNLHIMQNTSFQCFSDREFTYQQIIEENYEIQDNSIILTLRGIVPTDNPFDCIQTQVYDPDMFLLSYQGYVMQVAKLLGGTNALLCLTPQMAQLISIQCLGNYLNYNATIKKQLYDQLMKATNSIEKMEQMKKWPPTKWEKYDPTEIPLSSLNNQLKYYTQKLSNVTDYYNLRQKKNKNTFNAERIKKYLEIKLNQIELIKEQILEMRSKNRNQFGLQEQEQQNSSND